MLNLKENLALKRTKDFKHNFVEKFELQQETLKSGTRYYITPEGNRYKSVTTILGERIPKPWLQEWRDNVGAEEADRVTRLAGERGKKIHEMAEDFLSNKDDWWKSRSSIDIANFNKLIPFLNENIDEIYGLEVPLYSDILQTAGTSDCPCVWNGYNTILDFKTSKRYKEKEDISDYFYQASAYGQMFFELYGIYIEKVVILMTIDHDEPQLFVDDRYKYMDTVNEIFA